MVRVGIVGLDTSHPEAFAEYVATETDSTIAAVWDGGAVRESEYAEEFADRFDARRYGRSEAMIDAVDAAMVLTVDWDRHRELAVPFLEAGVPTLVDKPVAGRVADVNAIAAAASASETGLFGGSAVPFHPGLAAVPTGVADRTLAFAGHGDRFYYGAHALDTVRWLAGADWAGVEALDPDRGVVRIDFENGTVATVRLDGPDDDGRFALIDVADRTRALVLDDEDGAYDRMYGRLLDAFLEGVREGTSHRDRLVDGARLLLATRAALAAPGEPVSPAADRLAAVHADGAQFLEGYAPYR